MEIKVGDKFKGKINGAIFKITEIDEKNKMIFYETNGEKHYHGLDSFRHCLLEKID